MADLPPGGEVELNQVKSYLITTGTVFGLITVAHVCRVFAEGPRLAKDPFFVLLTFAAAALCFWAFRLLRVYLKTQPREGERSREP
jgi:hypothetical protein